MRIVSGIGVETARALASVHAHVIITARDMARGAEVVDELKKSTGNDQIEVMELDLNSLQSVRTFVEQFRARNLPINILICKCTIQSFTLIKRNLGNAGVMACPAGKTADGFETQFGVNHLAHFLLVTSLVPELKAGKPSRVVVVSSIANRRGGINWDDVNWENNYDKWAAYGQSKTANILFARQFNKLYSSEGVQAFSLHPGGIMTNLLKFVPKEEQQAMGFFNEDGTVVDRFKTVEQGASTSVYAALAPELEGHGGEYLENCAISKGLNTNFKEFWGMGQHAVDTESDERLWKLSEELVAAK